MVIAAFWPVRRRKPPTAHPGPAMNARVAPERSRGPRGPRTDDDERARPFSPRRRGVTPAPAATPGPPCLPSGGDQYPSRLPLSTSRHVTLDPPRTRASSPGANSDASNSTVALAPARPAACVTLDPDPFAGGGVAPRGRLPRVSLPAFPEACEPATPWPETTPCIDPVGPVSIRVADEEASESRSESESTPMSSSSSSSCGRS
mmetsp:Transcript_6903/g.28573  ORF Transcript_6903/g.28573 Transcript_6903/m.28573 type:complete len:204 (+) Transcript_6903:4234-4845(+)